MPQARFSAIPRLFELSAQEAGGVDAVLAGIGNDFLRETAMCQFLGLKSSPDLTGLGLTDAVLLKVVIQQMQIWVNECGGLQGYVPRCRFKEIDERNDEIRRDFNGRNHWELAKKHRISEMRVRQILDVRRVKRP